MKREREFFNFALLLATVAAMLGFAAIKEKAITELLKPYGMTIAMLLVMGSILKLERFQEEVDRKQLLIGALAYAFSVLSISLVPEAYLLNCWMAGAAIAVLYLPLYWGLAMQGILTCLFCSLYSYSIESFVFYGLIGCILCILSRYMTSLSSFFYVLIISLSSNLTLIFIMNNFIWKQAVGKNTLYSLSSTAAVVLAAYLLYPESQRQKNTKKAMEEPEEYHAAAAEARLEEILSESFPLRQRLQEYSQELYRHSLHISSVAQEAAACVGCNDKVVQAGGLYHEIGRLAGKAYIDEGVRLGEEYALPQEVINIIRQHNSGYEKPKSIEAAVVMITDSIVSTIEYMEREQKGKKRQVSAEKLIEQIFDIRLAKGTLDESGMDIKNYKKLKEFFKNVYRKGENA